MRKLKQNKGITLVALVITIIILLILAGITLGFVFGKNGIIGLAEQAGKNYIGAEGEESNTLEKLYSSMLVATNDGSQVTVNIEDLKNLIKEQVKEEMKQESKNPTGTVISYMGNNAPEGYLPCDGEIYNILDEKYTNLAQQIKTEFGSYNYFGGDGETTFAVPNLQGEFLRGTGTNMHEGNGNGGNVGIHQDGTIHRTGVWATGTSSGDRSLFQYGSTANNYKNTDTYIISNKRIRYCDSSQNARAEENFSGVETYTSRPTNTSVLYCIKY